MAKHAKHAAPASTLSEAQAISVPEINLDEAPIPAPTPFNLDKQIKEERRRKRRGKIVIGVLVAFVALIYAGGCVLFTQIFYPNTTLAGHDVSLQTNQEVSALVEQIEADYMVEVSGYGIELSMAGSEAGVTIDGPAVVASVHENTDVWKWPYELFQERDLTDYLKASVEGDALADAINAAVAEVNATATPPTSATVGYDPSKQGFVVVAEVAGTQLEPDVLVEQVVSGAEVFALPIELTDEVLTLPSVLQNDPMLPEAAEAANALLTADLSLKMGGIEVARLGHDAIASWVDFDEALVASINEDKKTAWVNALVEELTTKGDVRTYKRGEKEIEVEGGDYGWDVDDKAFAELVEKALAEGQSGEADIPLKSEAAIWLGEGQPDWGNRYIDIDLSEQHAYMFDESGNLNWQSDIVSGAPRTPTPTGVYYIKSNNGASTLKGTNLDGSKYESKVRYWMPFKGGSHGLHDADWQWSFGGTRYRDGAGSHGCVNLPVDKAKEISKLIKVGDPVVVHW